MSTRTVVIFNNDYWHDAERDPDFGRKLLTAIREFRNEPIDVGGASVVASAHHSDVYTLEIAGNTAHRVSFNGPGFTPPKVTESTSIDMLYLTVRATNTLSALGVKTIGELIRKTPRDLRRVRLCGPVTVSEIQDELRKYGFSLTPDRAHPKPGEQRRSDG